MFRNARLRIKKAKLIFLYKIICRIGGETQEKAEKALEDILG